MNQTAPLIIGFYDHLRKAENGQDNRLDGTYKPTFLKRLHERRKTNLTRLEKMLGEGTQIIPFHSYKGEPVQSSEGRKRPEWQETVALAEHLKYGGEPQLDALFVISDSSGAANIPTAIFVGADDGLLNEGLAQQTYLLARSRENHDWFSDYEGRVIRALNSRYRIQEEHAELMRIIGELRKT